MLFRTITVCAVRVVLRLLVGRHAGRRPLWTRLAAAVLLAAASGCCCRKSHTVYDPNYAEVVRDTCCAQPRPLPPVEAALSPVVDSLAGPHSVDEYIAIALAQNPSLQSARKNVEAAAYRVPQAASLEDPEVSAMGWPFYPNVPQTASGRMTADVNVSQKIPWCGKLRTKASAAEAEVDVSRAELRAVELETVEQVRRRYYELYYLQNAIRVAEESLGLAQGIERNALSRYRAGQVSDQDVLRPQVETLQVENELIVLRQELVASQAQLARLLHILPDTPLRAFDQLPAEQTPRDLERLYAQALVARPELHAQLAMIQRDREMVEFARLQYYPDVTLVAGWGGMTTSGAIAPTADGIDNINTGLMVNVPIYHQRLNAGVREAEAKAVSSARRYDAVRDETLAQVKDLFVQAEAQQKLTLLFRDGIIPKAQQTFDVSVPAYSANQIDVLTLLDNWRQLLRYRTAYYRLESQLRQTLATLDRVVGGVAPRDLVPEQLPPANPIPPDTMPPPNGPERPQP